MVGGQPQQLAVFGTRPTEAGYRGHRVARAEKLRQPAWDALVE